MGNYMNKVFPYNNETNNCNENVEEEIRDSVTDGILESDSMHTPPIIPKILPVDPRSATSGIDRTPIQVDNNTPVLNKGLTAIPRYLQNKGYLETDIDNIMCLTPKKRTPRTLTETKQLQASNLEHKYKEMLLEPISENINKNQLMTEIQKERYYILGLDPRSPAADFDRTPLLKPRSLERLKARSRESLQRQGSYEADQFYPSYSYCEMSSEFNVTEVQALPDLASCVLKSLNLDALDDKFTELDSENCNRATRTDSPLGSERVSEDQEIQTSEEDTCNDKNVQRKALEAETCVDDNVTFKVWRDSLVSDKSQKLETDDIDVVQEKVPQMAKEEVIITFDEDNITKDKLSLKLAKSEKLKLDAIGKKKKRIETKDERKLFTDKNGNGSAATVRTPLGNRSNAYEAIKNSPQQTFRSKGVKPIMLQENTPPHKRSVTKSKAMQWDPNSTVII